MSEPLEYASKAALLRDIAEFLYGRTRDRTAVEVEAVYKALPLERLESIDSALKKMDALELISLQLREPVVRTLGYGKTCFEIAHHPSLVGQGRTSEPQELGEKSDHLFEVLLMKCVEDLKVRAIRDER